MACVQSHPGTGSDRSDSHSAPNVEKPTTPIPHQKQHSRVGEEKEEEEGEEEEETGKEDVISTERTGAVRDLSSRREDSADIPRSRSQGNSYVSTTFNNDEGTTKDAEKAEEPNKQFEVRFDGDSDPMNPRSLSRTRKWIIVAIVSAGSTCVTCASSMYTLTYGQITTEFHISREVATLGLSLFVMGLGLGPMFLGPLSEFYGRRPIYIVSFGSFLIWLIPCALAKNIETELVSRFIDGFAGSGKAVIGFIFPCPRLHIGLGDKLQQNTSHFIPQTSYTTHIGSKMEILTL